MLNEFQTRRESVENLVEMLLKRQDSPHYALGYLTSLLTTVVSKYPESYKEILETIDWLESQNNR